MGAGVADLGIFLVDRAFVHDLLSTRSTANTDPRSGDNGFDGGIEANGGESEHFIHRHEPIGMHLCEVAPGLGWGIEASPSPDIKQGRHPHRPTCGSVHEHRSGFPVVFDAQRAMARRAISGGTEPIQETAVHLDDDEQSLPGRRQVKPKCAQTRLPHPGAKDLARAEVSVISHGNFEDFSEAFGGHGTSFPKGSLPGHNPFRQQGMVRAWRITDDPGCHSSRVLPRPTAPGAKAFT